MTRFSPSVPAIVSGLVPLHQVVGVVAMALLEETTITIMIVVDLLAVTARVATITAAVRRLHVIIMIRVSATVARPLDRVGLL